jgi:5-methylcytosine-specific restriction endonuclease McrA
MGKEVHHLQHQSKADNTGMIRAQDGGGSVFHKNHLANLMTLCEACHNSMHKEHTEHVRRHTNNGSAIYALDICS